MSLPEVPPLQAGTPPSSPEPEFAVPQVPLSDAETNLFLRTRLRDIYIKLDDAHIRLLYSRISYQSEAQKCQALQQGLETFRRTHFGLKETYKSLYKEYDGDKTRLQEELDKKTRLMQDFQIEKARFQEELDEKTRLVEDFRIEKTRLREELDEKTRFVESFQIEKTRFQEDLHIANELIASQKQYIDMLQCPQQQLPASHLVQGGPLLSQCNDQNHSYQYSSQPPPPNHEYLIDPAGLRPLDGDYSIGSPVDPSSNTNPAMSSSGDQTHNLSIPFVPHPTSAERDAPGPAHAKTGKRGPEDDGTKTNNKKRKTK